ncbi:MAG: 4-hydroxy-3-methylbut-2-en-1-yl diphosphate synthase (flavodoxin) [Candidatus Hydrogenedentota bacterium]
MKGILGSCTLMRSAGLAMLLTAALASAAFAQYTGNEDELIAVLQSDAAWQAKFEACRALQVVGTAKSVPALAALLNVEKLGHAARNALEPMPYPEVDQALRDALASTTGLHKAGVIISLGERRDAKAASMLAQLLNDADAEIARSAAGALGRIGTEEAAKALMAVKENAADALSTPLAEGLLAAAQQLAADGNPKAAMPVLKALLAESEPEYVRTGAFRAVMDTRPKQAPKRLIAALAGNDPVFRDLAAQIVSEKTDGSVPTSALLATLPTLPPGGQAALIRGLGDRQDPAARETILELLGSDDKAIQAAAFQAVGKLANADDVVALAALLASPDKTVADLAMQALTKLKGAEADAALAATVASSSAEVKAPVIELLGRRMAPQAAGLAAANIKDADADVRFASLKTLTVLGSKEDMPAILATLEAAKDDAERGAAAQAVDAISRSYGDEVLPALLASMASTSPSTRVAILAALNRIGSPKALEAVVTALGDADASLSDEAARVLADWPNAEAAPHLLALAQGDNASRKDLGLRGYVRLARSEADLAKKAEMLTTATGIASKTEEKWLVLGAWGTLPTPGSLDALKPYLDDPAVQNEAAAAIVSAASELGKQEAGKAPAIEALKAVMGKATNEGIKDRAQRTLTSLGG